VNATQTKWDAIYQKCTPAESQPAQILTEYEFLLPATGSALDLACGLGANAIFLAQLGLTTQAWDISPVAIQKLQQFSRLQQLIIEARQVDLASNNLPVAAFDVIVISRFLDRSLSDAIIAALKPGGLLIYQTFTAEKFSNEGPRNPAFLLQPNELLQLFKPLRVVVYRELAGIGNLSTGLRNEAQFIGYKQF
jgi:tellurite methyltransferase